MEFFRCNKTGKVGHFKDEIKAGTEFPVLRNIRNECVLIVHEENKPNIIASERELRMIGSLSGKPVLGGV